MNDSTNRGEHPNVSPEFFDLLKENRALRDQLGALREELARLVGYHQADGVIPLAKIAALLGMDAES